MLQVGTMVCLGLWITALATQHWHVKTYYLGFGAYTAQLKLNLVTYGWHCLQEPPTGSGWWNGFVRSFCGKPWMDDAMLTEMANRMCAVEEQSFGLFKVGCEKVSIVAYVSMGCMVLVSLSCLFTVCGAVFITIDPAGKPVAGLFTSAPIMQFIALVTYVAVTYDLSDFYDVDQLTNKAGDVAGGIAGLIGGAQAGAIVNGIVDVGGKVAVNDIDEAITFGYSFFIAVGGLVCNCVLAWCAWLFVADSREREEFAFAKQQLGDNGTFQQQGWDQQGGWDQHQQQQGWDQQQQQQWGGAPGQQFGGGVPPPGQQWTTTTTQWTGAGPPPAGFGAPAW